MQPSSVDEIEDQIVTAMRSDDWATVARLEAQLDAAAAPLNVPVLLVSAALFYAQIGLHVFPLVAAMKIPYPGTHGFEDATTDQEQIAAWWQRWPEANIGIATGHLIDVIDIDGPLGVKSWSRNIYDDPDAPITLGRVRTPRPQGTHLWIAATGEGNGADIFGPGS